MRRRARFLNLRAVVASPAQMTISLEPMTYNLFAAGVVARYAVRQDEVGWTVMDTLSNAPANSNGQVLSNLPLARAEIVMSLLNWLAGHDGRELPT